ncbi:uncharacterized protein GGS22DRAFT_172732 [Annulohypoxylon maeteangense]|uniref:uncharacterized protein n=1 Tax=Annulohypoxylon maeteangense TaxID=1927788 RepID=UPI002008EA77|nr:uncharacterized protein GGS22DRAFT_172732 [Annulohypoxylon maeteangense]KAI0881235.1 hypothetical protein GGS22DRAFT_172732 [Annulohypoxylon maeteangense]
MRAFTYFVLSFVGTVHSLPAFLAESKRSLINLSPDVDLGLNLENDNSCLGIGISVCDPITVDSKTSSTTADNTSSSSSSKTKTESNTSSDDNSLINLSPTISPDLNLSNENSCLGIGISACDPITVGSDVTKTVTKTDGSSDETTETEQSSYPTASTQSKSTTTTTTSNSGSSSGGSLLNLSPTISPDLNLVNDNSCTGIGISACDPITVDSTTTQNAS